MMELNNFRFQKSISNYQNTVFNNVFLKDIRGLLFKDKGVFVLATQFFYIYSKNDRSVQYMQSALDIERKLIKIQYKNDITNDYEILADQLISRLLTLFSKNMQQSQFNIIRNQYIEYIILYWKSLPGKYTKVYNEPVIFYKRKKCFDRTVYGKSLCDIVHIDRKLKHFDMYECKTTMKAFLLDLSIDYRLGRNKNHKKMISRSKRKQNYMSAFRDLLLYKVEGLKNIEVAYVTIAPPDDLYIKNKNVENIGSIPIFHRNILIDSFFSPNL